LSTKLLEDLAGTDFGNLSTTLLTDRFSFRFGGLIFLDTFYSGTFGYKYNFRYQPVRFVCSAALNSKPDGLLLDRSHG